MTKAEKPTPVAEAAQNAIEAELRRREDALAVANAAQAEVDAHKSVVFTYADGSQRVGVPPFPAKSPIEEKAEEKRRAPTGMVVPDGMKQMTAPPVTATDLETNGVVMDNSPEPDRADLEAIAAAIAPEGGADTTKK